MYKYMIYNTLWGTLSSKSAAYIKAKRPHSEGLYTSFEVSPACTCYLQSYDNGRNSLGQFYKSRKQNKHMPSYRDGAKKSTKHVKERLSVLQKQFLYVLKFLLHILLQSSNLLLQSSDLLRQLL